jgi:hypothetical protein
MRQHCFKYIHHGYSDLTPETFNADTNNNLSGSGDVSTCAAFLLPLIQASQICDMLILGGTATSG